MPNDSRDVIRALAQLNAGEALSVSTCGRLREASPPSYQCGSLAVKLASRPLAPDERSLLTWILDQNPEIHELIAIAWPHIYPSSALNVDLPALATECIRRIIKRVRLHDPIGPSLFARCISEFMSGQVSKTALSVLLALIRLEGLSIDDTIALTEAMVASGDIVDYRPLANKMSRRILRRYPTGGVSEKVSLILPSLLLAMSNELPILSTVLVGRSLGFTGGTWDKLLSIPGFRFPSPGAETEDVLMACNVAMCTTNNQIAPADRGMYILRSQTGNVESDPLIISSIASKHLAIPPHRILLDVRFGDSAFLEDAERAQLVASHLRDIFESHSISCTSLLIPTSQPTGVSIGNALEVLESLYIMGAEIRYPPVNPAAVERQKELVVEQAVDLVSTEFRELDRGVVHRAVNQMLSDGTALKSFWKLLSAHSVAEATIVQLQNDPSQVLMSGLSATEVSSPKSGQLAHIDLREIGNIVNFGLASLELGMQAGANRGGVWLNVQEGGSLKMGEQLCLAVFDDLIVSGSDRKLLCNQLTQCFHIR